MATPEPEEAPVRVNEEEARVFHWRIRRFMSLGFTLWQARTLAHAGADWHAAEKLIGSGCPVAVAFDVLS